MCSLIYISFHHDSPYSFGETCRTRAQMRYISLCNGLIKCVTRLATGNRGRRREVDFSPLLRRARSDYSPSSRANMFVHGTNSHLPHSCNSHDTHRQNTHGIKVPAYDPVRLSSSFIGRQKPKHCVKSSSARVGIRSLHRQ